MNGRLGWVPFINNLIGHDKTFYIESKTIPIKFDEIKREICCMNIVMDFEFGNQTLMQLGSSFFSLNPTENEDERPIIDFGKSINTVNFKTLMLVLKFGANRVNFRFTKTKIKDIINREDFSIEEDSIVKKDPVQMIIQLVRFGHKDILDKLLKFKKWDLKGNKMNDQLAQICLTNENYEMLRVLMEHGIYVTNLIGNSIDFFRFRQKMKELYGEEFI